LRRASRAAAFLSCVFRQLFEFERTSDGGG